MAYCPNCGAALVPPYRFCEKCGHAPPAPMAYAAYPYPPPRHEDHTALIIVLIVVLLVVLPIIMAAFLYVTVSHLIGTGPSITHPTVAMMVTNDSGGANIVVVGAQPAASPSNYQVNLQVGTAFGTAQALPTVSGGNTFVTVNGNPYAVIWENPSGSGTVVAGDHLVINYPLGAGAPPSGTTVTFFLLWASDGATVSEVQWTV